MLAERAGEDLEAGLWDAAGDRRRTGTDIRQGKRILSFLHKGKKFSRRTGTGLPAGQTEYAVDQPDDGESCSCGRTASADRSHY